MSQLRIFSYLPNPRIWKATIAARLCGVDVEVRGGSPKELASWLWDFDARGVATVTLNRPQVNNAYNGDLILTAAKDKVLRVFNARTGKLVSEHDGHEGPARHEVALERHPLS